MLIDYQKQQELKEARERDARRKARETIKKYNTGRHKGRSAKTIRKAKNLLKNMTPWGALSLLGKGNLFSDWMYLVALCAAVFKDFLDLTEATGIAYPIVVIATFCVSILIGLMMTLGGFSNGFGRVEQKIVRSWLILIGTTAAESLFGVNLLPLETLSVLVVYGLLLSDRKEAAEESEENEQEKNVPSKTQPQPTEA